MKQNEIAVFFKKSINFGFYSLALFSPLSISGTQAALAIILLSWTALMITEKRFIFAKTPLNYPFLAYLCAVFIGAIFGIDFIYSIKSMSKFWIALTFFAMLTFIEDIKMIRRLVHIILLVTSIVSIYGVLQHVFPGLDIVRPEGRKVVQWADGGIASTGFFDHHMTYGGFLLLVFSLSFSLSLSRIQQIVKSKQFFSLPAACCLLPTILISAGLLSSMTRNGWLGAVFAVIFIVILKVKRKIIAFSIVCLIITSYFLLPTSYLLHSPILNRFKSIFDISKNVERLYIWKSAADMIMEHPITGVGMNNYTAAIKSYRDKYGHDFSAGSDAHAHNNVLTQAAEHGILGFTAFLWIWIVFFREGIKIFRSRKSGVGSRTGVPPVKESGVRSQETKIDGNEDKFQNAITLGGLGAIAGFHVAGIFEANFGDAEVATMAWFIMGLVFLMKKDNI
ncbi:MAG: O-antigen ligase family protein [Nitrospinae bacterium]|nr:O-antigen ligase family protein [Nitrospinota bacterium]